MLIGYMHHRKTPFASKRAYAFASVAKSEGAELLYFSPGAVDFENRVIHGYMYAGGQWAAATSRWPDVIYNTASFSKDTQLAAAERLQLEIPFTSYSIGSKTTVFRNLTQYKTFANYLVPSEKVASVKHFFALAERYPEMVFKPSSGHQGIDVYYIRKEAGESSSFRVRLGAEESLYDTDQLSQFVLEKITREEFIAQPYICCRTKFGEPYDFRLHVQKTTPGGMAPREEWTVSSIYPRIAPHGSIVCNISQGGHLYKLSDFLEREFGKDAYDIQKTLEAFALQLAAHMDEIQKDLYGEELDELGIDIGLDTAQWEAPSPGNTHPVWRSLPKLYIYEVNWRPGYPPALYIDLSVVKNTVRYAMFLAARKQGE